MSKERKPFFPLTTVPSPYCCPITILSHFTGLQVSLNRWAWDCQRFFSSKTLTPSCHIPLGMGPSEASFAPKHLKTTDYFGVFYHFSLKMFAQSSSVAGRAQQSLSLLQRRLIICEGHGEMCSFSSQNLQKAPAFSSENPWGFSGNDVLSRVLVPLHLSTGFRYFFADREKSSESHDEYFSENSKEINKGRQWFQASLPSSINKGNGFKRRYQVRV